MSARVGGPSGRPVRALAKRTSPSAVPVAIVCPSGAMAIRIDRGRRPAGRHRGDAGRAHQRAAVDQVDVAVVIGDGDRRAGGCQQREAARRPRSDAERPTQPPCAGLVPSQRSTRGPVTRSRASPIGSHSYDIAAGGNTVWAQSYGDQAVYKIQQSPAMRATTAA
jgi:hypothetical protein